MKVDELTQALRRSLQSVKVIVLSKRSLAPLLVLLPLDDADADDQWRNKRPAALCMSSKPPRHHQNIAHQRRKKRPTAAAEKRPAQLSNIPGRAYNADKCVWRCVRGEGSGEAHVEDQQVKNRQYWHVLMTLLP